VVLVAISDWIEGARPRTLPAAVAPVAVGTGAAWAIRKQLVGGGHHGHLAGAAAHGIGAQVVAAVLALVVALALQVGVNYANDYSDGIRGTDDKRVGPTRLTAGGLATPVVVKRAAFAAFGVAAIAGLALTVLAGQWWLVAVGAAAIAAAWFYTGGTRPYGYAGLGEVFVFVFFGLVAVLGTTFTQVGRLSWAAAVGAVGVGVNACALLVVNNLRDIPTDSAAGKRTLAVRLGDAGTRRLFTALLVVSLLSVGVIVVVSGARQVGLAMLAALPGFRAVRTVLGGAVGRDLILALQDTGRVALFYGVLVGLGLGVG